MSESNKISISRALTRLSHNEDTWTESIRLVYGDVFKDGKSVNTGKPINDVRAECVVNIQSTKDRLAAMFQVRKAINAANQTTQIVIGEKTFTIAEALIYKHHILPLEKLLLAELRVQVDSLKRKYATEVSAWENLVATKDADKIESLRDTFCPSMTTPIDTYLELEAFIRTFETELSAALSESNALTQIEP